MTARVEVSVEWDGTNIRVEYDDWAEEDPILVSSTEILGALDDCYHRARRAVSEKT